MSILTYLSMIIIDEKPSKYTEWKSQIFYIQIKYPGTELFSCFIRSFCCNISIFFSPLPFSGRCFSGRKNILCKFVAMHGDKTADSEIKRWSSSVTKDAFRSCFEPVINMVFDSYIQLVLIFFYSFFFIAFHLAHYGYFLHPRIVYATC